LRTRPFCNMSLFIRVRGRLILRSPNAEPCIGAPVLRRSRPLLMLEAQQTNYYMLRVRMKMLSGAYASWAQDTDYTEGGGGQEFVGGGPLVEVRPV
jgi:hypothetical protein